MSSARHIRSTTTPSDGNTSSAAITTQSSERTVRREANATINHALQLHAIEDVQHLDTPELQTLQLILQHGTRVGHWQTPPHWHPVARSKALLDIDLNRQLAHFLPDTMRRAVESRSVINQTHDQTPAIESLLQQAVLIMTRYLVLLRIAPAGMGDRGTRRPLSPSSVQAIAYYYLPKLVALAVSNWLRSGLTDIPNRFALDSPATSNNLLRLVRPADVDGLASHMREGLHIEIQRMTMFADQGWWHDVPDFSSPSSVPTSVRGRMQINRPPRVRDVHLPLPDNYVAEMGQKSLWLIQTLGPNLLTVGKQVQALWETSTTPEVTPHAERYRRHQNLRKFLDVYEWHDSTGNPIAKPPFVIRFAQKGKHGRTHPSATVDVNEWPPKTFIDIMGLMQCLQLAHLFVVALSMGGRRSELLSLTRSCLQGAQNGRPNVRGRTFKQAQAHEGDIRNWVLPDLAITAIDQQARLIALAETIGPIIPRSESTARSDLRSQPTHLWTQIHGNSFSDRTAPLTGVGAALERYAKTLGMSSRPGGQRFRSHRFRKTIARLAALAMTQAPKVLMHVFGHRSIEMTLHYILTDTDLQADIEKVSRELRIMRATQVVETMLDQDQRQTSAPWPDSFGGLATDTIHHALRAHQARLHQRGEQWGAHSAVELAEILTLQGKAWNLVRPGIICTKLPGTETGPCNKSRGHPEPSRCQTHCRHRLEEAFLHDDVDRAIRDALDAYRSAKHNGEGLMQAMWAGQIRTHLSRFEDLHQKWMANSLVCEIMQP